MRILSIETSCDETAIAVVSDHNNQMTVEKQFISSQISTHAVFGGVVPEVAAREHIKTIFPMLKSLEIPHDGAEIDAIAVTQGPGLVPSLRIGVELAKCLAWLWKKPLVPVNHLEGHVYSVWLNDTPEFPVLALLVSGGHTELILMKDHGVYELVGMTRDDAAGEAFDKVAKLLGLSYPGGPAIAKAAKEGNADAIFFPRPMLESLDFDFSFSGLKTAVANYLRNNSTAVTPDVAAGFQAAVIETLVTKTLRACEQFQPRSVALVGGVSANTCLRETLTTAMKKQDPKIAVHLAPFELTGDNAVMIGIAGLFRAKQGVFVDPLLFEADPNLRIV